MLFFFQDKLSQPGGSHRLESINNYLTGLKIFGSARMKMVLVYQGFTQGCSFNLQSVYLNKVSRLDFLTPFPDMNHENK